MSVSYELINGPPAACKKSEDLISTNVLLRQPLTKRLEHAL
jgi:hypothetical protein